MTAEPEGLDQVLTILTGELAGLRKDIGMYAARSARDRMVVRGLIVSVTFDIMLSFGLFFGLHRASSAAHKASRAASTQQIACQSANQSKTIETKLWAYVIDLSTANPIQNLTPAQQAAQKAQVKQFQDYVAQAFALSDCSKLGK